VNRRSIHRRDGRKISPGKIEQPAGTPTASRGTVLKLSQYSRADDVAAAGSQENMTLSSSSSLLSTVSGSPPQSAHAQNFSTIQAHCPAGESVSPYPSVCGRVDCCLEYPVPHLRCSSMSARVAFSRSVRSVKVERSGPTIGMLTWTPTRCDGCRSASVMVTIDPQSPPWAA